MSRTEMARPEVERYRGDADLLDFPVSIGPPSSSLAFPWNADVLVRISLPSVVRHRKGMPYSLSVRH